jgi:EAL domain-containing protein (putative c-di-GMP-specific phosphodiesterase class I)/CheY-like chemotaxis protein
MADLGAKLVTVTVRGTARAVLATVLILCALSYLLSFLAGGASAVPPHGFYIPLVVLGIRFGTPAVLVGSVGAAVLAGPLLPAVVATGAPQKTSDWVTRGVFFAVVSSVSSALARAAVRDERARHESLRHEAELRAAIQEGQLEVRYQPIVRMDSGAVVGAEALVRWHHPQHGIVTPDRFIPLAERTGLIHLLGAWVLERTVEDMREWKRTLGGSAFPIEYVGINVSRSQFLADGRFVRQVDHLARAGALPVQVMFEVTETGFVEDQAGLVDQLVELQLRGFHVAMDDFGTGQSSLAGVRDLPLDTIKIDLTFVADLVGDPSVRDIVTSTVDLARRLGKDIVAEGVETEDQRDALLKLGVLRAQGYLFAPPLTFDDFRSLVSAQIRDDPRALSTDHRILVVDDRQGDHLFVAQLLADWGEISFARSGPEAIELISNRDFTIVLLDIQMPHMSGLETARAIRTFEAQTGRDRVLTVGLSARDLPEDERAALSAGMDAYLTKPLTIEAFERALRATRSNTPRGPVRRQSPQ